MNFDICLAISILTWTSDTLHLSKKWICHLMLHMILLFMKHVVIIQRCFKDANLFIKAELHI